MASDIGKNLATISAVVDQMVASIRDILISTHGPIGYALNDEIEANINRLQSSANPVERVCGDLMEIGHCVVLDSLGKAVQDHETDSEPPHA